LLADLQEKFWMFRSYVFRREKSPDSDHSEIFAQPI